MKDMGTHIHSIALLLNGHTVEVKKENFPKATPFGDSDLLLHSVMEDVLIHGEPHLVVCTLELHKHTERNAA